MAEKNLCEYRNPCGLSSKLKICIDVDSIGISEGDDYNTVVSKIATAIENAGTGEGIMEIVPNYSALPDPTTVPNQFYYVENSQGTKWLPGSIGGTYYPNGLYYSNGISWITGVSPWQATQVDVDAGIIADQFVSPKTLNEYYKWSEVSIAINFKSLSVFEYVCPENIQINTIESQFTPPTVLPAVGTPMDKYDSLNITPTSLGLVILKGVILP